MSRSGADCGRKLGFVGWNTLWYVIGGGAWANTEYTATGAFSPPFTDNVSFNHINSGWVVGGGAEWQVASDHQHPAPGQVSVL